MSDDGDNYEVSDTEVDDKRHDKLIDEVLNLNKIQNVKKPSRTEPTLNISEFNLVKSVTGNKDSVQLNALTSVLKGRKKHKEISTKVKSTSNRSKTLPAPLEKPQAERIRRSVNYEKSRLTLDRWEALVTSNRVATQLRFPLNSTEKLKIEAKKSETYPSTWRIKSDLQTELHNIESKVEEYHINQEEDKFPLTLQELKERRREAAKLRAHQGYKEAKARRQSKIKSKKYHRILRREKIKQKLKEFEELQKTNPEEALKKLEDIEKARAEERFSLRHKGTGQWARNKQIRAKYDKESRQVLAQQLALSRELTQKLKNVDSDSDDNDNYLEKVEQSKQNIDNPWISGVKPSKEVSDFIGGYRKYWTERNKEMKIPVDNKLESDKDTTDQNLVAIKESELGQQELDVGTSDRKKSRFSKISTSKLESDKDTTEQNEVAIKQHDFEVGTSTCNEIDSGKVNHEKSKEKLKTKDSIKKKKSVSTSEWAVSLLKHGDVEDIFNKLEKKVQKKLKEKYKKVKNAESKKRNKGPNDRNKGSKTKMKVDLSFNPKPTKVVIDEQMSEEANNHANSNIDPPSVSAEINQLTDIMNTTLESEKTPNVDPHKFMQVKVTKLNTAIPDILTTDENEENDSQRDIILEAFEGDDIADEFMKEKENEVKKDSPQDIDLNLPGWGSWAGTNIKPRKRRKRFIIKMPAKIPRRDDNKGFLIINEKGQSKVKTHMVSELPFPFKNVKDYEANVKAPISNTFLPETAFRKLIEPPVVTKMGAIIEPISKSVLVGEKKV
ncbi:hypothetical protein NQ315_005830 [Exocentrus adspersus]|uniref:U3 small nucleolar RNA-associated protein 14 homolog A n=1 Tax=Exocentrus adspersus TaxID=1586481 RepID=A0AAV8VRD8_9CUCU|nr:hypothetical protein NQ315_005830 [Exocentrus adspersus]